MRCVQAMIAGVVAVSAAANDYSPQAAIGLGCLAGVAFYLISRLVFRSALEDYCNVVAVHLGCAIFGSLAAPICAARADEDVVTILLNFAWQLICLMTLMTLVGATMLLLFGLLQCCGVLRNRSEYLNHVRANAAIDRGPPRSFLQRLFFPDSGCLYLQPSSTTGTDSQPSVGSRFWKYQTEIDKLEEGRPVAASKPVVNVEVRDNFAQDRTPGRSFPWITETTTRERCLFPDVLALKHERMKWFFLIWVMDSFCRSKSKESETDTYFIRARSCIYGGARWYRRVD